MSQDNAEMANKILTTMKRAENYGFKIDCTPFTYASYYTNRWMYECIEPMYGPYPKIDMSDSSTIYKYVLYANSDAMKCIYGDSVLASTGDIEDLHAWMEAVHFTFTKMAINSKVYKTEIISDLCDMVRSRQVIDILSKE